jgi:hypothetical protein
LDIYSRPAEEDFYTGLSSLGEWIMGGSDTRRGGGPGFTPWSISFLGPWVFTPWSLVVAWDDRTDGGNGRIMVWRDLT